MSEAHIRPVLAGQKALVVGVANDQSIAYGCAKAFRTVGAELAITCSMSERAPTWNRLPRNCRRVLPGGWTSPSRVSWKRCSSALPANGARWTSWCTRSLSRQRRTCRAGCRARPLAVHQACLTRPVRTMCETWPPFGKTDQHHSIPSRTAAGRANAIRPLASAAHTEARSIGRAPVRDGPLSGRRNSDPTRAGRSAPAHRNRAGSGRPTRPQRIRVTLLVYASKAESWSLA